MSAPSHDAHDRRFVVPLALVLVLVATGFRAWSMRGTWFYYDDFPFLVQATQHRLTGDYLMAPYLGHLMPAGRLFAWLATRGASMDYFRFAFPVVGSFAVAGLGMARLLITLFGPRWGTLPPLAVFLFSPLLVESTLWWSAAVNQIPALIAIVWGLDAHVRFLRGGRRRHLVASLAWVVVGLAFAELALLAYVFLAFITLAYFARGTLIDRARTVWDQHRPAVVAHGVLVLGYLAVYLLSAPERLPPGRSHPLLSYFYDMGAKAFATTAIGGPLRWRWAWAAQIEVAPSDLLLLASWTFLGALLLAAHRSRLRATRSTILVAGLLALKVLLVSSARGVFGPAFALDVRFAYDLAPAYALCLGLAFMPVLRATESAQERHRDPWVDDARVVSAACLAFVILATVSTARFPLRHLEQLSPEAYVANLRSSLADLHGPVTMAPGAVPIWVTGGVEGRYSNFLPLISNRFSVPKVAIDRVYLVGADGLLVPAKLAAARNQDDTRARARGCPFPAANGDVTVPLDGPVFGVGWMLDLSYQSTSRLRAEIATGDLHTAVDLPAGTHRVLLPASATYDRVEIRAEETSASLCVDHVTIGTLSAGQ